MAASPLAGKTVLVTGASGGIGAAAVVALADAGADIAACDLRFNELGDAALLHARRIGRTVYSDTFDVADPQAGRSFVDTAVGALDGLDGLVSTAVYSDREPFTTADLAGMRRTVDVSLWGSFFIMRAVARALIDQRRGGAMVIVSSPHAVVPFPNCMAYNMAKAAQDSMARTAATELLPHKVRVNLLHPGWTDTPGERKFYSEADLAHVAPTLPPGRLATPAEIARGIVFLLDPASEYINGTTLTIDGGLSLPWWSKRGEGRL